MNNSIGLPRAAPPPSPAIMQVIQLTTTYWASRCMHVVAELGVADALGDHPQSTEALAEATSTHPQSLFRVLRLLASHGIFELRNGAWNHTESSRLLRSSNPKSLRIRNGRKQGALHACFHGGVPRWQF
jgi:hypothetical protein